MTRPPFPSAAPGSKFLSEDGGLSRGRSTLVCGGAGCRKTMMALEFPVRGALKFGGPGGFMMFGEMRRS